MPNPESNNRLWLDQDKNTWVQFPGKTNFYPWYKRLYTCHRTPMHIDVVHAYQVSRFQQLQHMPSVMRMNLADTIEEELFLIHSPRE